ncbi:unnamed protein product [Linum tenue]|uniref:RRM domain-containing protein n=1 Tax=Linum tenue TaxID=586396 RepID=A0AAV0MVK2_9ROSI|nr:unnamed protein product [Linum tenue]
MAMDPYETTNLLLSKIKTIDPDNASKIMGYILIHDVGERELAGLAFGPETFLLGVIAKAKTHLGLSPNTLSAATAPLTPSSPLNPISRPVVVGGSGGFGNPFSHSSSPRLPGPGGGPFVDFARNPSPHSWPVSGFAAANANNSNSSGGGGGSSSNSNVSLSPKSSPFLSYDSIRAGSFKGAAFSKCGGNGSGDSSSISADALEDYPFDEYLSFLDDPSSRNDEFDPGLQLAGYPDVGADAQLHRRRFSESDACPNTEDGAFGIGYRPCLNNRAMVGSPREMESLYLQQHEGMMRLKAAHHHQQQQRLAYSKYMNFLLQQQNDTQRLGGAAAAMNSDEFHKFGRFCTERNEFYAMAMAEKANSASRQIYLTFPADSTFKDEDVSNYFSTFGPVEDVRIPYQQKRMFGFVTFVHSETVKLILARGNPHFICDSRVLVKPYKEKGKAATEHQLLERGNFSPCSSPSGLDGRELYDLPMGGRVPYNSQEMMLRRKLEEQAELQQAIELQGRRLVNLQLPDLRGDYVNHHQRSLSMGGISLSTHSPLSQKIAKSEEEETVESSALSAADDAANQNFQPEVNHTCNMVGNEENINNDASNLTNCHGSNAEHVNRDAVASQSKSSLENVSALSNSSPSDTTSL